MLGHLAFHRRPDALLTARARSSGFAAASKWRFDARRAVVLEKMRRQQWMTEEAAKAFRKRSLLEDNPASG